MRNIIVHYHIFKNAGTSIDRVLEENFGAGWATLEGSGATSLLRAPDVQAYVAEHPGLEAISSHLARPPLPQGFSVLPIVFLRHPLDRAASVYSQERRAAATVKSAEIAKMRDFRGYVQWCLNEYEGRDKGGGVIRNYQVVHLSDASFRNGHIHKAEADRHDLQQAIRFLNGLPFFGIVEKFQLSLRLLQAVAQKMWPRFHATNARENISPDRTQNLYHRMAKVQRDLGFGLWQWLVEENALDFELYAWAREQFRENCNRWEIA